MFHRNRCKEGIFTGHPVLISNPLTLHPCLLLGQSIPSSFFSLRSLIIVLRAFLLIMLQSCSNNDMISEIWHTARLFSDVPWLYYDYQKLFTACTHIMFLHFSYCIVLHHHRTSDSCFSVFFFDFSLKSPILALI